MAEITINDTDIAEFGARLLSYTVGGTEVTNTIGLTQNIEVPKLYRAAYGRRKLTVTVVFRPMIRHGEKLSVPDKLHRLTEQKIRLDSIIHGDTDIRLPDGYLYKSILESIGEEVLDGESMEVTYQLTCIRLGDLERVEGSTVYCHSTATRTDCRILIYVGNDWNAGDDLDFRISNRNEYNNVISYWRCTVVDVNPGDTIEIDGISHDIYKSGVNVFASSGFKTFPSLRPGKSIYECYNHPGKTITYRTYYYPTFL